MQQRGGNMKKKDIDGYYFDGKNMWILYKVDKKIIRKKMIQKKISRKNY